MIWVLWIAWAVWISPHLTYGQVFWGFVLLIVSGCMNAYTNTRGKEDHES